MENTIKNENYFIQLNKIKCDVEKKKDLNYISWADAWAEVKKTFPDSNYVIYENSEGFPFWESKFGIDCKVGVTINGVEHIVRLPVMDGANKTMFLEPYEYTTKYGKKICEGATQFDINKTIQRAFTKAIAMHGIGLYVFRGEDFPEDYEKPEVTPKETTKLEDNKKPIFDKNSFELFKKKLNDGEYDKENFDDKFNDMCSKMIGVETYKSGLKTIWEERKAKILEETVTNLGK